jgi:hypothetical protein
VIAHGLDDQRFDLDSRHPTYRTRGSVLENGLGDVVPVAGAALFLLWLRDLVAHPLADQLALELGKGQQHVERQPPH